MQLMAVRYSDFFTVERDRAGAVIRFEIRTILDSAAIREVATDLYALVEQHGLDTLVMDLAGVRFLSSQALGSLVNLQRKCTATGGRLLLAGVSESIGRMLRITRLDCLLAVYADVGEALGALRPQIRHQPAAAHS